MTQPDAFDTDRPLYHWSPTSNRRAIQRAGLTTGRPDRDGTRYGLTCFADSPSWAWQHALISWPDVHEWDLWMTWRSNLPDVRRAAVSTQGVSEWRTWQRVWKRNLWYVASRTRDAAR